MERSLKLRRQKSLDRASVKRLIARGRLHPQQICLAATTDSPKKSPLILPRLGLSEQDAG
jgi:hypothetical protein